MLLSPQHCAALGWGQHHTGHRPAGVCGDRQCPWVGCQRQDPNFYALFLSANEPRKQRLTEGYQVPAVLPREDNLAEIAHYLLKESLVSGVGSDIREMVKSVLAEGSLP